MNLIQTEIHLAELQKKLDDQGVEIVDNQKEGLLGRKALADKTKGLPVHWL
jgi:homeobox protein cut-like